MKIWFEKKEENEKIKYYIFYEYMVIFETLFISKRIY